MYRYLARKLFDVNDVLTGYKVSGTIDKNIRPNANYAILEGAQLWQFKKAELQSGKWVVVEDTVAKDAYDQKVSDRTDRRVELGKITQLRAAIDANFTAPQATVLKKIFREIIQEIKEGKY